MARYSLTDYILSVKVPEELRDVFIEDSTDTVDASSNIISIGGDGSYTGSITITNNNAQFTTDGDVTGSWVHNKSKDQTGTIKVNIKQVSDKVLLLVRLYQTYYASDTITEGLTLTVSKATGNGNQESVCVGTDCYINQRPDIVYGDTADGQEWTFTCGRITFTGDAI